MSILDHCPLIRKAALLIYYNNGIINREEPEFLEKVEVVLGAEGVALVDVLRLEAFLGSLSDEHFESLCICEHVDQMIIKLNYPVFSTIQQTGEWK